MPRQADRPRLLHEQLVAAAGDRRQRNPFARYLRPQCIQRAANRPGRSGRIRELPVAGETNGMKLRQLSGWDDWRLAGSVQLGCRFGIGL